MSLLPVGYGEPARISVRRCRQGLWILAGGSGGGVPGIASVRRYLRRSYSLDTVTSAQLASAVVAAVDAAVRAGELFVPVPETATIERPRHRGHGDYATTVALDLAEPAGRPAREVAGVLAPHLRSNAGARTVEVAGPGFLNVTLETATRAQLVRTIVQQGSAYGHPEALAGQSMELGTAAARHVPLRTQTGTGVANRGAEELIGAVGDDAGRYALSRVPPGAPLEIDLDLWSRRTDANPAFYVQYTHAHLASVHRHATDMGVDRGPVAGFRPGLLEDQRETRLLGILGEFPRVAAEAADFREPHRIPRYLEGLVAAYDRFHRDCRALPQGDEETTELARARLWLCEATRIVLRNGLHLLGVRAPERM